MKSRIIFHIIFIGFMSLTFITGCSQKDTNKVVVYVSTDQVFSEPTLRDFEKETGIQVKAVYDTEGLKKGKSDISYSNVLKSTLENTKGNQLYLALWTINPILPPRLIQPSDEVFLDLLLFL